MERSVEQSRLAGNLWRDLMEGKSGISTRRRLKSSLVNGTQPAGLCGVSLITWVGESPLGLWFLEEFLQDSRYCFLKCLAEFNSETNCGLRFWWWGRFLSINSISAIDLRQFWLCIASLTSFDTLHLSRNLCNRPSYQNYFHKVTQNAPLIFF